MFYIDQLCTQSFPFGLVKTESGFVVRSVETGLGRWRLVVAVISIDVSLFLVFFTIRLWEWLFSGCTLQSDSKKTKLGRSDQEASPSETKNTRVVLVLCWRMEVHPYSYFWWCGYFWGPWVSFVTWVPEIRVSWTHSLPFVLNLFKLMNYGHIIKSM